MSINDVRQEIDRIDRELVRLLNQRAARAIEIGRLKKAEGTELYVPSREESILEKVTGWSEGPLSDLQLSSLFRAIMTSSLGAEANRSILYLGTETEAEALASVQSLFGTDLDITFVSEPGGFLNAWDKRVADIAAIPAGLTDRPEGRAVMKRIQDGEMLPVAVESVPGLPATDRVAAFRRKGASVLSSKYIFTVCVPRWEGTAPGEWLSLLRELEPAGFHAGVDDSTGRPVFWLTLEKARWGDQLPGMIRQLKERAESMMVLTG